MRILGIDLGTTSSVLATVDNDGVRADLMTRQRQVPLEQLKEAVPLLEWATDRALASGVLAEQVNPYTNEPLSVSPLTWAHATYVQCVLDYLEKRGSLELCPTCHNPHRPFRMRKTNQ